MMDASPDAIRAAFREFDNKIASIPGVEAVSQTWGSVPMAGDDEQTFWFEGQPKPANPNDKSWAIDYIVEPGYLKAMEIPLLRGRFFTNQEMSIRRASSSSTTFLPANTFPTKTPSANEF